MFEYMFANTLLVAGKLAHLSNQEAILTCYRSIRQSILGVSDSFVSLAMALAGLFVGIKLIRLSYDTMSDEQGGGLGGVKLSQILVPVVMIALIAGYKYFIGALDYTVSIVVEKIADTSQISDKVNSNMEQIEDCLNDADNTILADAYNVLEDYKNNYNRAAATKGSSDLDATMSKDFGSRLLGGGDYEKYRYSEDDNGERVDNWGAIKKILKQYGRALAKSDKETSGRHGLITSLVSLIFNSVFLIVIAMANLYLCVFVLLGPFTIALSLFEKWQGAFVSFIGKYIEISFWMVIAVIINWLTTAAAAVCTDSVMSEYASMLAGVFEFGAQGAEAYYKFSQCMTTVTLIRIAGLIALFSVPDITSAVLSLGGGAAMGGAATGSSQAKTAAQSPGKAAGAGSKMILLNKGLNKGLK